MKIAVLGGGISTGRGASSYSLSWLALWHRWLEYTFGKCPYPYTGQAEMYSRPSEEYERSGSICAEGGIVLQNLAVASTSAVFGEKCMVHEVHCSENPLRPRPWTLDLDPRP